MRLRDAPSCGSSATPTARARVEEALELARHHGLAERRRGGRAGADALAREAPGAEWAAYPEPELIVESLPEELELKADVMGPLCARHRDAIVATNTSSIADQRARRGRRGAERIVGTHYWNPPLLMPLVEVLAGDRTAARILGPGRLAAGSDRQAPGHARAGGARAALEPVAAGAATRVPVAGRARRRRARDDRRGVRDGLARRWRLTGPFETVGLGGAATFDAIAANLFPVLSDAVVRRGFGAARAHGPRRPGRAARAPRRRPRGRVAGRTPRPVDVLGSAPSPEHTPRERPS